MSKKPDFRIKRDKSAVEVDPDFDVLKEAKKNEIIKTYNETLGVNENLLRFVWQCCENLPEKTIKQIRKGTYNPKFKIKRDTYTNGQVLKTLDIQNGPIEILDESLTNHYIKKIEDLEEGHRIKNL